MQVLEQEVEVVEATIALEVKRPRAERILQGSAPDNTPHLVGYDAVLYFVGRNTISRMWRGDLTIEMAMRVSLTLEGGMAVIVVPGYCDVHPLDKNGEPPAWFDILKVATWFIHSAGIRKIRQSHEAPHGNFAGWSYVEQRLHLLPEKWEPIGCRHQPIFWRAPVCREPFRLRGFEIGIRFVERAILERVLRSKRWNVAAMNRKAPAKSPVQRWRIVVKR